MNFINKPVEEISKRGEEAYSPVRPFKMRSEQENDPQL
jgi:hypothetical protein